MGALALAATLALGGVSGPAALPLAAHADTEEEAALPQLSRFASPSEKRAAMAERRMALLRAAREQAESQGSVAGGGKAAAPAEEPAPSKGGTDLQSMLKSLNTSVSPCLMKQLSRCGRYSSSPLHSTAYRTPTLPPLCCTACRPSPPGTLPLQCCLLRNCLCCTSLVCYTRRPAAGV